MKKDLLRRLRRPTVGVVVPAWGTEQYLSACLDSLIAQTWTRWTAVVVDDGSPDRCGEIAEAYAARDSRIKVLHVENGGLGRARNRGTIKVTGDYLAYLDSDDVFEPTALADMVAQLEETGSDFVTASLVQVFSAPGQPQRVVEPEWLTRLHGEVRRSIRIEEHPEIMGDVFAVNKLFRRSFWDEHGLRWADGVRYEDQPTTTRAYLLGTFDVIDRVVYRWQIREDGSSITQQRAALADLVDRWKTKRMAYDLVLAHGHWEVTRLFRDWVMPGDMPSYYSSIPGCSDEWWDELRRGQLSLWEPEQVHWSCLTPDWRVCAALVAEGRRDEAVSLVNHILERGEGAWERNEDGTLLSIPADVLNPAGIPTEWLQLRDYEMPPPPAPLEPPAHEEAGNAGAEPPQ